ncbi:MAG: DNA repair protein RecO [Phycisphaerales bacterium]|nr:DNA repair protein RecO [Phycisphaerales bacterium]
MATLRDEAIVLRLTEYSESSQIATLFAAEAGQLRLIAKGVRRSTRQRFAPGLDLLECGGVQYVPARGDAQLGTLTEWRQREAFGGVRRALLRLYGALYATELVAGLTEPGDPAPELYRGLYTTLATLAGEPPAGPAITGFQETLLRTIGYAPVLDRCVSCNRGWTSSQPYFFSSGSGGLICRDCEPHLVEKLRVLPGVLGSTPTDGPLPGWFALFDYHLTHVAGRRFQTAPEIERLLREPRVPGL